LIALGHGFQTLAHQHERKQDQEQHRGGGTEIEEKRGIHHQKLLFRMRGMRDYRPRVVFYFQIKTASMPFLFVAGALAR
jgi:hypothetical protein